MKRLTRSGLLAALDGFIAGRTEFEAVRCFVLGYFEAEEELDLENGLEDAFSVIGPYLEYEEAYGDEHRLTRMRRFRSVLSTVGTVVEHLVFALEFDRICKLHEKLQEGRITRAVYDDQLRKLSPVELDVRTIALWAAAHEGRAELDLSLMWDRQPGSAPWTPK